MSRPRTSIWKSEALMEKSWAANLHKQTRMTGSQQPMGLPDPNPAPPPLPKVNQKTSGEKTIIKIFNLEFPGALKKPLDLLYSNLKGACGKKAEEIDFDA